MAYEDREGMGKGIGSDSKLRVRHIFTRSGLQFYFINCAGVVLFIAAALNFFAAAHPASPLDWADSLFQLKPHFTLGNRWTLILSGGLELFVSGVLLGGRNDHFKLWLLSWFLTTSATYRVGLRLTDVPNLSDCLGNYVEWFSIRPQVVAEVFNIGLGFMLVAAYGLLLLDWLALRRKLHKLANAETEKPALGSQRAV
jgi:hypothetical protein